MDCLTMRNREVRGLKIGQHFYVQKIAERFRIVKTSMIPMKAEAKPLLKENGTKSLEEEEEEEKKMQRFAIESQWGRGRSCGSRR